MTGNNKIKTNSSNKINSNKTGLMIISSKTNKSKMRHQDKSKTSPKSRSKTKRQLMMSKKGITSKVNSRKLKTSRKAISKMMSPPLSKGKKMSAPTSRCRRKGQSRKTHLMNLWTRQLLPESSSIAIFPMIREGCSEPLSIKNIAKIATENK